MTTARLHLLLSVAQWGLTLGDPMDCSMPVLHHLLELAQIHVHWVGDATQPSHPLSFSSPAFNLSQHQGLFQWVSSLHQVAKVLELPLQHHFQWTPRTDSLYDGLVGSPCNPRDSQESSSAPQFKCINSLALSLFLLSNSHTHTRLLEKPQPWPDGPFVGKLVSLLFNMLSRFLIAFLPGSKRLLISWPQSPSTVILVPKKIVCHSFHYLPIYLPWSDGTNYITSTHHICFLRVDKLPEGRATCYTHVIPGIRHHSWYTSSSWYQ